ncbi:MAG: iron-sulfur cluster assembly scaffold protein [Patescibacteria group bacterium]|nr:iron-sulfur cluster assembly scaffold protein [Patescibacteria group bacterium]MBU0879185.1 iron-sulfur cluster assembly scaffold protein [Patescibacteria group bacterium]MBU0880104.1 iron-sulfur cluster assembly scaffold protein [Patescibacteria group bacterium]MBU0898030.1 iron-sulfur cluster assembly scaffold protein [Patescibacteria group bacterium]MBU1063091.1 iron-sulfur cluster assembly scaffold protein [Patescibacteria group bacterium]
MYSKKVIQHFQKPHNQGQIKNADAVGRVGNPACGDIMKIYLKIKDKTIKDVKFETMGCAAAIAVSSVLTDLVKNKTLVEALKVDNDKIVKELGGLPEQKIHCSMLAVKALKKAVDNYQK